MKKLLAIGIILLLIGLVFTPCINANIGKDDEFVNITINACGIEGIKSENVKVSQDNADEIIRLFKSIEKQLENSSSQGMAEKIFNEAVIELDKLGVLPRGLSIEDAQRLVTGNHRYNKLMEFFNGIQERQRIPLDKNENFFCLMAGRVIGNVFFSGLLNEVITWAFSWIPVLTGPIFLVFGLSFAVLYLVTQLIFMRNPICIGRYIYLGLYERTYGTIASFGLNGLKVWNNNLTGLIPHWFLEYVGAVGFTGLQFEIFLNESYDFLYLFLGFALKVKIKED